MKARIYIRPQSSYPYSYNKEIRYQNGQIFSWNTNIPEKQSLNKDNKYPYYNSYIVSRGRTVIIIIMLMTCDDTLQYYINDNNNFFALLIVAFYCIKLDLDLHVKILFTQKNPEDLF